MTTEALQVPALPPLDPAEALDLSIIIVNWNTRDLLADCLQSVYDTVHGLTFEVFVVDNASTDGSAEMVRARFPQVRLIENAENVGFARANNQAIRQSQGEYVLLLNPDTIVYPGTINMLYDVANKHSRIGALGAQLVAPDGSLFPIVEQFPTLLSEVPFLRRLKSWRNGRAENKSLVPDDKEHILLPADWVCGACMMIRRAALDQVGALDEEFWLYGEELEWCWRAQKAGWLVAACPNARVLHFVQASSRQNFQTASMSYTRGRALYYRKTVGILYERLFWALAFVRAVGWVVWLSLTGREEWWGTSRCDFRRGHAAVARQAARCLLLGSIVFAKEH